MQNMSKELYSQECKLALMTSKGPVHTGPKQAAEKPDPMDCRGLSCMPSPSCLPHSSLHVHSVSHKHRCSNRLFVEQRTLQALLCAKSCHCNATYPGSTHTRVPCNVMHTGKIGRHAWCPVPMRRQYTAMSTGGVRWLQVPPKPCVMAPWRELGSGQGM